MSDKKLHTYITNDPGFMENGCTLYLRDGGPCWFVDPGMSPQANEMIKHVREHSLAPEKVLFTHGHADHIAGVDELVAAFDGLAVHIAKQEWAALTDPMENLSSRLGPGFTTNVTDPKDLVPGEDLELDGSSWRIIDTSGHSPGGRSFYCREHDIVLTGDALFASSVGRVDFHHSNGAQLMSNIKEHLLTLPDETRVIPGHGPETTIGQERTTNPFVMQGI